MEKYLKIINEVLPSIKINSYKFAKDGEKNDVVFINNDLVFRFQKTITQENVFVIEKTYLNTIKPYITTDIPQPEVYRYNDFMFCVYPLIYGILLKDCNNYNDLNRIEIAKKISLFLKELHSIPNNFGLKKIQLQDFYKDRINKNYNSLLDVFGDEFKQNCDFFFNINNFQNVVCHNDLHNANIIIDPEKNKLNGIIDFSDMVFCDYHADFVFLSKDCEKSFFNEIVK
jgi:aminoglycoside 2''-phosphotransferase